MHNGTYFYINRYMIIDDGDDYNNSLINFDLYAGLHQRVSLPTATIIYQMKHKISGAFLIIKTSTLTH